MQCKMPENRLQHLPSSRTTCGNYFEILLPGALLPPRYCISPVDDLQIPPKQSWNLRRKRVGFGGKFENYVFDRNFNYYYYFYYMDRTNPNLNTNEILPTAWSYKRRRIYMDMEIYTIQFVCTNQIWCYLIQWTHLILAPFLLGN